MGKTTVSATIALHAARAGRKTLVMTIDPARRLAQALGVDDFGDERHQVSKHVLSEAGVELKGDLYALMPNVQRTFDALLTKLIADPPAAIGFSPTPSTAIFHCICPYTRIRRGRKALRDVQHR